MITLHIPDADPQNLTLNADIRREVALLMYQHQTWSMGQATRYAGMPYVLFQQLLGDRGIVLNYDETDFMSDVASLRKRKV